MCVLLALTGCGGCRTDPNFGFSACGPVLVP